MVPGGFGHRGIQGKIDAIQYARVNDIPFFGICLGMQLSVVETARHMAGLTGANSSEFDESSPAPVIDLMLEQKSVTEMGGTMRLGSYPCVLNKESKSYSVYKEKPLTNVIVTVMNLIMILEISSLKQV